MKRTAYWLTIAAAVVAIAVLWVYNGQQARADYLTITEASSSSDTVVTTTILDNSRYPDITALLECSGTDVKDMVAQCRAALLKMCPDGGRLSELTETAAGVLPAKISMKLACQHEPTA